MAVNLAVAGDFFEGVIFCAALLSHKMSWMGSGKKLCQFLRIFSTYICTGTQHAMVSKLIIPVDVTENNNGNNYNN